MFSHSWTIQEPPVYVQLTREFLSSLIITDLAQISSSGTLHFRMFNVQYRCSFDQMAEFLHLPHGDGEICEVPGDQIGKIPLNYFGKQSRQKVLLPPPFKILPYATFTSL